MGGFWLELAKSSIPPVDLGTVGPPAMLCHI